MSNVFGDFLATLVTRIQQAVPALQYTGQDQGQLEHFDPAAGPQIGLPCALISFREFEWRDLPDNVQQGMGFVQIRLGIDPAVTDPATWYSLQQQVHAVLQGNVFPPFGKLLRRMSDMELRENKYRVGVIRYVSVVEDLSTKPEYTAVPRPGPVVNAGNEQ